MYMVTADLGVPNEVLTRLTDDEGAGTINITRAEAAISAAQAVLDCSLSKLYAVPFPSPPQLIRKLNADIAIYFLYQRLGQVPEDIKFFYGEAMRLLENAASGKISLAGGFSAPGPDFSCQPREFSREYMEGF